MYSKYIMRFSALFALRTSRISLQSIKKQPVSRTILTVMIIAVGITALGWDFDSH